MSDERAISFVGVGRTWGGFGVEARRHPLPYRTLTRQPTAAELAMFESPALLRDLPTPAGLGASSMAPRVAELEAAGLVASAKGAATWLLTGLGRERLAMARGER